MLHRMLRMQNQIIILEMYQISLSLFLWIVEATNHSGKKMFHSFARERDSDFGESMKSYHIER